MSTPANPLPEIPTADQVLLPASNEVEIEGVAKPLMEYAVHLAYIHWLLFGKPLIITSGTDGIHAGNSLHPKGRALDLRTYDLTPEEALVFFVVLAFSAPFRQVAVFDERAVPPGQHVHIEYHGE